MSIENDLGRIATALETIAKIVGATPSVTNNAVTTTTTKTKKEKPVEPEPDNDPFASGEDAQAAPEVTFDALKELLTKHAGKFGTKLTIALIQKHGADKVTPKINTIPKVNFAACYADAAADLKKAEGKK